MNRTTRIYLLRHGETEWNTERRIQGHQDSRLTARGRRQAVANGLRLLELLDGQGPLRYISSPLGRCRETAHLVCGALGIDEREIELDDRLMEHAYGDWEGKTIAEVSVADRQRFQARAANRWDIAAPNGENYTMVAARLRSWLADIDGQAVVAISHGCAGRILRTVYADLSRSDAQSLAEAHDEIHVLAEGRITTYRS